MRLVLCSLLVVACTHEQSTARTEVIAPAAEPTSEPAPPPAPTSKHHKKKHHGSGGDRDADGIADDADKCPDDPEDLDGYEDEDGCPDPDNDQDGVLDINDNCPNDPGPPAKGGCP
jgi:hypothetical protein